jgi:hypothetical protein
MFIFYLFRIKKWTSILMFVCMFYFFLLQTFKFHETDAMWFQMTRFLLTLLNNWGIIKCGEIRFCFPSIVMFYEFCIQYRNYFAAMTEIKPKYCDILYNLTHFPGPLVCWIRQVLTSCTIWHISLVLWCVGLDRFHCVVKLGFVFLQ